MVEDTSLGARRDHARGLNDNIATGFAYTRTDEIDVLCECGHVDCSHWITIRHGTYRHLRRMDRWLVVANGHELPELDRVTARHDSFAFVEPIVSYS
jgi:hypothetical protein